MAEEKKQLRESQWYEMLTKGEKTALTKLVKDDDMQQFREFVDFMGFKRNEELLFRYIKYQSVSGKYNAKMRSIRLYIYIPT